MAVNKELLKGNAQTLVLKILSRREMYGYQLSQELAKSSDGNIELKEGSLYPLLHALETDGAVEAQWKDGTGERRRKYYRITQRGRKLLKTRLQEWENFRLTMDLVLSPPKFEMKPF